MSDNRFISIQNTECRIRFKSIWFYFEFILLLFNCVFVEQTKPRMHSFETIVFVFIGSVSMSVANYALNRTKQHVAALPYHHTRTHTLCLHTRTCVWAICLRLLSYTQRIIIIFLICSIVLFIILTDNVLDVTVLRSSPWRRRRQRWRGYTRPAITTFALAPLTSIIISICPQCGVQYLLAMNLYKSNAFFALSQKLIFGYFLLFQLSSEWDYLLLINNWPVPFVGKESEFRCIISIFV